MVEEAERDEVVCPGVEGENLAARALAALRESGWERPPLRIEIAKRIPVAAGLGGGSADAAAVLRLAAGEVGELEEIAAELGADVPSQLVARAVAHPRRGRAGRAVARPGRACRRPAPRRRRPEHGGGLRRGGQVGSRAGASELEELADHLKGAAGAGASPLSYPELLFNDLEPAARSLRPGIGEALDALREVGAQHGLMTGSGPTAFGLFESLAAARAAAARLDRDDAIVCAAGSAGAPR